MQQVLNQGTGPDTPIIWKCPIGRDWTPCRVRFTTSDAPKPSLQFQLSAPGTVWLDDVSLTASCDHPATHPTRTYGFPTVRARYWRFTILESWNTDGTFAPEPTKGEGPVVEYIQFKSASGANQTMKEVGEGSWITETSEWTVTGQYHPNGPISHLIAPCDGGFWNAGGTPQPWRATITLPAMRSFGGFRFADAFPDEDHLRSFVLEVANSTSVTTSWQLVLNETGLPNHRPNVADSVNQFQ